MNKIYKDIAVFIFVTLVVLEGLSIKTPVNINTPVPEQIIHDKDFLAMLDKYDLQLKSLSDVKLVFIMDLRDGGI